MRGMRFAPIIVVGFFCAAVCSTPASAEVRFGHNVRVGGHDFSNQTFDQKHRAEVYLYNREPRHAGCSRHPDGRGGEVKVCHLKTLNPH